MGSLFGSLASTAESMRALERAVSVVQNNVVNSSTPGFAKQTQILIAKRCNPAEGLSGGISAGDVLSARSQFSEDAVRRRQNTLGNSSQKVSDLAQVEQIFTVADGSGINGAMGNWFKSLSQLTVTPNDSASRQVVLDRSQALAAAINSAAVNLGNSSNSLDNQARSAMDHINKLAGEIAGLNQVLRDNSISTQDSGISTRMNTSLEELSKLTNYTAINQADGSVSVYLGGQTPLVLGTTQYHVDTGFQNGGIQILSAEGKDITAQITGGQLSAMLEEKNTILPGFEKDLNLLASSIADRVNTVLSGGVDRTDATPTTNLFTYDAALGASATLQTNTLTLDQLAAALPGAPGGNGNALNLSALSSSKEIDGYSYTEFYGNIAAKVGREVSNATADRQARQQLLNQAVSVREEVSGVNLDEQAALLIELQRGYQAASKMLTVLNEMTTTVMGLLR